MKAKQTHKSKLQFLTILGFLVLFSPVFAQESITLTGKIIEEKSGEPIVGATVVIKGTQIGIISNANGEYSITAKQALPLTLVVSVVGYANQEIDVYEAEPLIISLHEGLNKINEVVVIGYGTQKRQELTGAIASVPSELKVQPVASVERLLQGAVAGAIVTQTSGQPGGGVSVQIRGANSINAASDPLYVIDGFPINNDYRINDAGVTSGQKINPLSNINSSDIENIEVLKDASATAIYGSRGANGVILVTTKKGKSNESSIEYDGYYGLQEIEKTLPLLTAGEWWQLRKDAAFNTSLTAVATLAGKNRDYYNAAITNGYQLDTLGKGTDWQKAAFHKAPVQSHNLSIFSGNDKTRIAISGNYFDQEGIIRNTGFTRYAARFSIDHKYKKRGRILSYINVSKTNSKVAPGGLVANILNSPAAVPIYKDDGTFLRNAGLDQAIQNPINSLYNQTNETNTTRFLGNISGEYKIIEGLTAKVLVGADYLTNKQNQYLPNTTQEGFLLKGQAFVGGINNFNWLNENTISYDKVFNKVHSINIVTGFTAQQNITDGFTAKANNFASDLFTFNDLGSAVTQISSSSKDEQWSLASWLARVNYGYNEKYLLTLTVRADGSSRFGANNKWGTFPSAAIGWNVHKEKFLKDIKTLNYLKVRSSIGITGNQSIPSYSSLSQLSFFRYNFNDQTVSGFAPTTVPNPQLGWEKTFQLNAGSEIGLFNNRINLVFDYYYKKTSDLLLFSIVSGTSGLGLGGTVNGGQQSYVAQNQGVVSNKGFEVGINTQNLTGAFKWNTIIVFSKNTNEVLDIGNGIKRIVPDTNQPSVIEVGQPLGSFFVYETDGLIQPSEAGPNALTPQANKGAGSQKYKDISGPDGIPDGVISQAYDRKVIANQPGLNAGFTNTFSFLGFDASVFFQTSIGGKLYNQNRAQLELNNGQYQGSAASANAYRVPGTRGPDDPGNTNTDVKAAYGDFAIQVSDRFIEDASYVRLKNLSFGYSFPAKLLSKIKVKKLRVYVSAQNLVTWTKYTGYDPEASSNGQNLINRSVDSGVYPNNKSVQGGVQLTF